ALCTLEPSSSMVEGSSLNTTISLAIRSAKGCLKVHRTAGYYFLCRLLPWQFSSEFPSLHCFERVIACLNQ
ncbi:hypothetical protein ACQKP8_27330, partial [Photobacterium alginatilyticum]|uniref:hypothetical protein n=1 Tax=Photobacterium alginatilyticum TaxID=1775171 RepID=UPI00406968C3